MHINSVLSTAILALSYTTVESSPLFPRSHLTTSGSLRPRELVTRELEVVGLVSRQDVGGSSSSSPTGSTSSECGLLGCTSSGESASNETSTSSSTSCEFLGGCAAASGATCPVSANNDTVVNSTTSSSICGSSTSTNTAGAVDNSGTIVSIGKKLFRRIGAALAMAQDAPLEKAEPLLV